MEARPRSSTRQHRNDPGRLLVHLNDKNGRPVQARSFLLASENTPQFGNQYRVDGEHGEPLSIELHEGPYSVQAFAEGYQAAREFAEIETDTTTQLNFTLAPVETYRPPSIEQRLAVYGLDAKQVSLKPLTVRPRETLRLDVRKPGNIASFARLQPTSVNDIKRWVGAPDTAFGHDRPRFGPTPAASALALQRAASLTATDQSVLTAIAREYIYGNSVAVGSYEGVLNRYIEQLSAAISIAIFFFTVVTVDDGAVLEVGNGSSVFFADVLRVHRNGRFSVVGDLRADIGTFERFG